MKINCFNLILLASQLAITTQTNISQVQAPIISQGYVTIPNDLVIDTTIQKFVTQVKNPNTNLLTYFKSLGFLVDKEVVKISLSNLNYLDDQQRNLSNLDLSLKIITKDNIVSHQHLMVPCQLFHYLIKIPDKIDMTFDEFSSELITQTNQTLLVFLTSQSFVIEPGIEVSNFEYDQETKIIEIDLLDKVDKDQNFSLRVDVNLNPISFVSPNDKVIDNSGLYMSIGISLVIFITLGIYVTIFVLKVKEYKNKSKSTKQPKDGDSKETKESSDQDSKSNKSPSKESDESKKQTTTTSKTGAKRGRKPKNQDQNTSD